MNATVSIAPALSPPRAPARPAAPKQPGAWIRRNAMPALELALIVLLILGSIAGIWLTTGRDDEPNVIVPPVATPTSDATPDVPMYRGNPERTGVMPGPGIEGDPIEFWRVEMEGPINSAPALVDGTLYLGVGDGSVHAVDTASGVAIWTFTAASPVSSSPAVVNGIVYVGSENGTLYALDSVDGKEVWSFPEAVPNVSVSVVDGVVYTGTGDGFLSALDAATGEVIWQASLGAEASRTSAVSDGVVYQGSTDGILHTFDAATGEPGWTFQTEGGGVVAAPVIANSLVYQTTQDGVENSFAYALDPATGEMVWRFAQEFNPGISPPTVGDDLVYLPSADDSLYAVDTQTGEVVWQFDAEDNLDASPALVGDTLYVASRDGLIYALDAANGKASWHYPVEGESVFGPTVADGVAYLGTTYGYLYAIGGTRNATVPFPGDMAASVLPGTSPSATPTEPVGLATFLWATKGGPESLDRPADPTIAPDGTIWVADGGNSRFLIFSPEGDFLETWGVPGAGNGELNFIRTSSQGDAFGAVAFAPDGTFYVADVGNFRIQHFSADRQFLGAWGGFGPDDGEFLSPIDVAVDSQGNVFVDDDKRNDIQKFSADGTFLLRFGGLGSEPGQLDFQASMAVDAEDNVWVADPANRRVQQFGNDGSFLAAFDGGGMLMEPYDIAVDLQGRIFVADIGMAQVVVLDPNGIVIGTWGAPDGVPLLEMSNIELDDDGNAYVVSYLDGTLLKFQLNPPLVDGALATPVS